MMKHVALFAFLFVVAALIVILVVVIAEGLRRMLNVAPRYICAIRIAESAWAAWDDPTIAERLTAQQARALADQRDLERALIEVAHQKDSAR